AARAALRLVPSLVGPVRLLVRTARVTPRRPDEAPPENQPRQRCAGGPLSWPSPAQPLTRSRTAKPLLLSQRCLRRKAPSVRNASTAGHRLPLPLAPTAAVPCSTTYLRALSPCRRRTSPNCSGLDRASRKSKSVCSMST